MVQISNMVFCDDFIAGLKLQNRLLPNPYQDFPFLLIEGFIPPESVHAIARHCAEHSQSEQARIKTSHQGAIVADVNEHIRKTAIHALPDLLLETYHHAFEMHQPAIERFFNTPLTTATEVQALEYTEGGFYVKHADDSNELVDAEGHTVGFNLVAPERKITTVLFATSHGSGIDSVTEFEGGELCFNYLYDATGAVITLRPKAGDMIVFPSNPIFSHEVKAVRSGYRLTLVRWHNALT